MKSFILYLVIFWSIEALTLKNIDVQQLELDAEDVDVISEEKNALDHVGMTKEAAELRSQYLRNKKPFLRKKTRVSKLLFPGLSPEDYLKGDDLQVFAESVESKNTNIPFDYYKLPVCPAKTMDEIKNDKAVAYRKNLGQRLMGYSFHPTSYEFQVLANTACTILCQISLDRNELNFLQKIIRDRYRIHLTLDGLPVVMRSSVDNYVVRGFPVGFVDRSNTHHDSYYLYNHLRFTVYYNNREAGSDQERRTLFRITGFDVHPVSISHAQSDCGTEAGPILNDPNNFLSLETSESHDSLSVLYSYEVNWVASDVSWADRWDIYLMETADNNVHLFAIVNSFMITLFLSATVAVIMIRALKKDIAEYNLDDDDELPVDESGWKQLHGDVFRPPVSGRTLLSVAAGTGAQIGTSVLLTLLCAVLKILNSMKKGQILTAILALYVLSGCVAGYVSARLYKYFNGKSWKRTTLLTASAFPGVIVTIFMILNVVLSYRGASTAVSLWTLIQIFLLWVCVSTPLVFLGSIVGYRLEKIQVPTKTNQISRIVQHQGFRGLRLPHSAFLCGILPFGSVVIELYFIMGALWLHQLYYIMGFILAVCLILSVNCATISMVMCYLQLYYEDYRWWWSSFWNCACAGLYLFLYALWYLSWKLQLVGPVPILVYLCYMGMISFAFSLYCGTVGLISSFWFCRKIYSAIKID